MKVKSKTTGITANLIVDGDHKYVSQFIVEHNDGSCLGRYETLAELNKEWADYDYEKPKEYWAIDQYCTPDRIDICKEKEDPGLDYFNESIGNYFRTEEEAEKALERLRAWKRLKDKGFRFKKWDIPETPTTRHIKLVIEAETDAPNFPYDLDLLFGGEE